ncbi:MULTISPECIES: manganese catalase family protein [unclassified Ruminococcus]|uniref:manganese catalase family protein n=1 Tax=unclassified Ruminococcus TaxID=2608920 RepID=UPI00210D53C6|nr:MULTISPECIES: manganese catalase family protein [unclassified Ruminococcus]MCQ4023329.1 manganese catalase family protein [Ruminococcus sp. zg-924]MCQ4115696.1 manganese catalase family protein [Ruminococcus sp. zg-921]
MWTYEKKLQYPINIKNPNPKLAKIIITQYGGPDGELAASLRYLTQRFSMPYPELKAILTDIGTEELAHLEMIGAIVYQLTRNLSIEEIKASGFDTYFVDHTTGVYPTSASGSPFTAAYIQSKGDVITDLHEDLAAEQKARTTYDNILRFCDDRDVADPIRFLRAREVVHYQRFGEGLRIATDNLNSKNFYAFNPAFDICNKCAENEKKEKSDNCGRKRCDDK